MARKSASWGHKARGAGALFTAICVILALATTSGCGPAQRPTIVGVAALPPLSVQYSGGSWYWIERSKGGATRLIRAKGPTTRVVTTGDATLRCYAADEGHVCWCARQGGRWAVVAAGADGGQSRTVWTGDDEPFGVCLSNGQIYWLHRIAAPIPDGDPFPPLSPALEVLSAPADGREVTSCARLRESEDGQVLGVHAGVLYVAAFRHGRPGSVSIYRKEPGNSPPRRIAGMIGSPATLLTRAGTLYLLSPSAEATAADCLYRLDPQGRLEALSDWLPTDGLLYETERGVIYADRVSPQGLWPAGRHDIFPTRIPVPEGYYALAAGGNEMLLARADAPVAAQTLYRMAIP